MKILADINVLLDVYLKRSPWFADAAAVIAANHLGRVVVHVSAATVPTLFYIAEKHSTLILANAAVDDCLNAYVIVPVSSQR